MNKVSMLIGDVRRFIQDLIESRKRTEKLREETDAIIEKADATIKKANVTLDMIKKIEE